MREEIRELHEQRAAAMMTEIVELQKERDLAVAKVRRLEKKVKGKSRLCLARVISVVATLGTKYPNPLFLQIWRLKQTREEVEMAGQSLWRS